jgi:outer membrane lipoprotein carrier protein
MTFPFSSPLPMSLFRLAGSAVLLCATTLAHADAVDALKTFAQKVQSARAAFSQTVTSPDGAKKKSSAGRFEFQRPNRFRFDYQKPYEQTIVADGQKVWLYDADLNQVTVRPLAQALGNTPAGVLAGAALDRDFNLEAEPDQGGLQWVRATPKQTEGGSIRSMRVGFKGDQLAALEIVDAFGQRSRLDFSALEVNPKLAPQRFQFTPPQGADVLQQ